MQQPEKFISIPYQQIEFLIPNENVFSSAGIKDFDMLQLNSENTGIYDFDEVAHEFNQTSRESDVKTMIVLKSKNEKAENHVSIITKQECKVCTIPLNELSLFSDYYSQALKRFGILACGFKNEKLRLLVDVKQVLNYLSDRELEEL